MVLRFFLVLAGLSLASCDVERPVEDWGCCYYRCVGPRTVVFSDFFGSEALCEDFGRLRCEEFFVREQQLNPDVEFPRDWRELEDFVWDDKPESEDLENDPFPRICIEQEPPPGFEDPIT